MNCKIYTGEARNLMRCISKPYAGHDSMPYQKFIHSHVIVCAERNFSKLEGVTSSLDPCYVAKETINRLMNRYNLLVMSFCDKKHP